MPNQRCPTNDQLKAFSVGKLPHELIHEIADHVPNCRKCESRISGFDNYSDDLVDALQSMSITSESAVATPLKLQASDPDLSEPDSILLDQGRIFSARLARGQIRLGKFLLRSELGSGSFGYVFLALDTELDREVAIKIQRSLNPLDNDRIQRFNREARNAARLQHPSIVSIYETGQTDEGICYLVTEYVQGQTLQSKLQTTSLCQRRAVEYSYELAQALQYAHEHDVVHRDVKPSNIIIDENDKTHLADFGLAKSIAAEDTVTQAGQVMGTPAYMAPEQARGCSNEVDTRSDVYSLGVVMYEMLTGQQPFQGKKRLLLLQVIEDDPRPPSQLVEGLPRDLEIICLKAMSKLPRLRYQTAAEFGNDIKRYLDGEPILARPIGYSERFLRWSRRYPAAIVAFLTLFIGAAIAIIYLSTLSDYLVRQTARDSAEMQANMLDSINEYYAGLVKELDIHLQENGNPFTQADLESIRPVPAKFTIELGNRLESSKSPGLQVRLYSDYPFPQRIKGGPQDDFGRRALDAFEVNPNDPLVEFTELAGRPVVRFATPRVMTESCVDCHNNHRDTPKANWKVGDVRGVLEVIRPLERDQMRTRQGMGNAITWIIAMTVLLSLFVSVIVVSTVRRNNE